MAAGLQSTVAMARQIELVRACAWCTQVRNARNEWLDLEAYLRERFRIDLSHGICPDCLRDHAPEAARHHDCAAGEEEDS